MSDSTSILDLPTDPVGGGNITLSAALKAIDGDIKRARAAGASVKTIADLEDIK